jgi:hypothetical protein
MTRNQGMEHKLFRLGEKFSKNANSFAVGGGFLRPMAVHDQTQTGPSAFGTLCQFLSSPTDNLATHK